MAVLELDAREAMVRVKSRVAAWPRRSDKAPRLETICAPVFKPKFTFDRQVSVFTIGSCFARNIEEYLGRAGVTVPTLAFSAPRSELPQATRESGLLNKFTPDSMLVEVRMALDPTFRLDVDDCLVEMAPDSYIDLQLASDAQVTRDRARQRRREIVSLFKAIETSDLVIITLGLIESWVDTKSSTPMCQFPSPEMVAKFPGRFRFRVLSYDEVRASVIEILDIINSKTDRPKRFLVTTSPVPLGRTFTGQDVLVANCHSKSLLRTVAQELALARDDVDYFPSYESVVLSRSDLAWVDDLRHVRDDLVGQIVTRVLRSYFPQTNDSTALSGTTAKEPNEQVDAATQAKLLFSSHQFDKAYAKYQEVLPTDDWHVLLDYARACMQLKKFDEAYEAVAKAIVRGRESGQTQLLAALAACRTQKHLPAARTHAEKAVSLDPHYPYNVIVLASIYARAKDGKAEKTADEGLKLARGGSAMSVKPAHLLLLRKTYRGLGKDEKAREVDDLLEDLHPGHLAKLRRKDRRKNAA